MASNTNNIRVAQLLVEANQLLSNEEGYSINSTVQRAAAILQQSSSSEIFDRINRNNMLRAVATYNTSIRNNTNCIVSY